MKRLGWVLGVIMLAMTAACATAGEFSQTIKPARAKLEAPAPVYIYSFLDVRKREFGETMLASLYTKLTQRFETLGHKSEILRWPDAAAAPDYTYGLSKKVPVEETVLLNSQKEEALGARYRLIVFPSNFEIVDAWQYFSIRWSLIEIPTNRVVWGTFQGGSRPVWLMNDEDPDGRAETAASAVFGEMAASGLIPANAFPDGKAKRRTKAAK